MRVHTTIPWLKIPKFCGKFKKSWQKANIFTYLFLSELISRVIFLVFMAASPLVVFLGKRGARGVKTRFTEKNGFSPLVKFTSSFKADFSQSLGKNLLGFLTFSKMLKSHLV